MSGDVGESETVKAAPGHVYKFDIDTKVYSLFVQFIHSLTNLRHPHQYNTNNHFYNKKAYNGIVIMNNTMVVYFLNYKTTQQTFF